MCARSIVSKRSGQVLLEFALIALILYLLLAATFDFGRALYSAQLVQQAADVAAHELSHTPLPATGTLRGVLQTEPGAKRVFSEDFLVVTPTMLNGLDPIDYFADKPIVNQMLLPLMIVQDVNGEKWLQYPGQLVDAATPSGKTVVIPIVQYAAATETIIKTVPVLEEISPDPNSNPFNPDPQRSPFNLTAQNLPDPSQRGMIAVRINYPFQAAMLTGFTDDNGTQMPILANDNDPNYGPYAGPAGLGKQAALGQNVRPFRRVISAQAIYRRELFE